MTILNRKITNLAEYDVVIIGGGICGAAALLESSRRGMSKLQVEQNDFGSGITSGNFRSAQGGLEKPSVLGYCKIVSAPPKTSRS